MLAFEEGGKTGGPVKKKPEEQGRNQQQTQSTHDAGTGNGTRATLVGGECSPHRAIPTPAIMSWALFLRFIHVSS